MAKLRIGFIPEHFSTPLHFAQKHFGLDAELVPHPTGTGALTASLKTTERNEGIHVAIGLTEGFIADLGKAQRAGERAVYRLAGTYVQSPLCWAISTGAKRDDVNTVEDLKGKRVGVSRIGSGSYVMSYVLADSHGWLSSSNPEPFEAVVLGDHKGLRDGVRGSMAEFYMWEHFTTKRFWDNGELKRIGEIYTPWPSWLITARHDTDQASLGKLFEALNKGVQHYEGNKEEAKEFISSTMEYSMEDAEAWTETVEFPKNVEGVEVGVVEKTVGVLQKAGVLEKGIEAGAMVAVKKDD